MRWLLVSDHAGVVSGGFDGLEQVFVFDGGLGGYDGFVWHADFCLGNSFHF